MAKRGRKSSKKKSSSSDSSSASESKPKKKKMTAREREELLIENFVGLQHAMTNLSFKFERLSDNIVKLLQVFEESAKNYMGGNKSSDEELLKKINSLLDQNKTIAKGLVLMEEKVKHRAESPGSPGFPSGVQGQGSSNFQGRPGPKPLPRT